MIAVGEWRPTVTPVDAGARGFHLPAMISTIGDVTLSRLVTKWLAARASGPAALMSFVTTTLAEPWEDRGGRVQPHALATRLEDYGQDVDVPPVRVSLVWGRVLSRFGDVFGPSVNLAARLVDIADPTTVLVDRGTAGMLARDPRFALTAQPEREVQGLGTIEPVRLQWAYRG